MNQIVRRTVVYSGRVQGVGFRYTAQSIARAHPVVGYVRNLSNGKVELVVEGDEAGVHRFLLAVDARMSGNISDTEIREEPANGEFESFEICY